MSIRSEKEKMVRGDLYNAMDPELCRDRARARALLNRLSDSAEVDQEGACYQLFGKAGVNLWVQAPFYCDYGYNIEVGDDVFFNFNCVALDGAPIKIGSRTLFGPNVQIYTSTHPLDYRERAKGLENAKPIAIGDDVWVGGNAVFCPGVSIGDRAVIGAGSVVTKDIPADVVVAGNPAKIIRRLAA